MYKKAAEFWTELRVEILTATAFLANEKPISSQVWRLYWASHQVSYILRSWIFEGLNFVQLFQTFAVVLLDFLNIFISLLLLFVFFICCSVSLDICVCRLRCLLL